MFEITLRTARELCKSIEEVALHCDVNVNSIKAFENDSSLIPRELSEKLRNLYSIDPNCLYFGKEIDCIERNKKIGLLTFCSQKLKIDASETIRCYRY
ncbi:helix-turn-helix transcriptional regulator [Desulfosporosinus sp. OT]|uniref:helix-turn-helix transcriptional regulator n=1 Tax=Desulfosporosinus sp. OT TaxID=913865 RepID=UPI00068202B9|nr:helix-turn-helix transcriptional regulator [Desulfosporosinus sp. OT]